MPIPVLRGVIDRRILVNYRVEPAVLGRLLPTTFRPQLVRGWGVAGICLIRLRRVRPRWLPLPVGLASENAAHRIAVEWDDGGAVRTGVYILRRETTSRLSALAGGPLFPGVHRRADFRVAEGDGRYAVTVADRAGRSLIEVRGRAANDWPAGSVFDSLAEASAFFAAGSVGYSPARRAGDFEGLELRTAGWDVRPLAVEHVASAVFDDPIVFAPGSVEFDSALVMHDVAHEWHGLARLRTDCGCAAAAVG
ncbi:MAG TPA: DUF2071 domain-containing protein [Gemmataceae bacterium]|jgi:hypothetical protein